MVLALACLFIVSVNASQEQNNAKIIEENRRTHEEQWDNTGKKGRKWQCIFSFIQSDLISHRMLTNAESKGINKKLTEFGKDLMKKFRENKVWKLSFRDACAAISAETILKKYTLLLTAQYHQDIIDAHLAKPVRPTLQRAISEEMPMEIDDSQWEVPSRTDSVGLQLFISDDDTVEIPNIAEWAKEGRIECNVDYEEFEIIDFKQDTLNGNLVWIELKPDTMATSTTPFVLYGKEFLKRFGTHYTYIKSLKQEMEESMNNDKLKNTCMIFWAHRGKIKFCKKFLKAHLLKRGVPSSKLKSGRPDHSVKYILEHAEVTYQLDGEEMGEISGAIFNNEQIQKAEVLRKDELTYLKSKIDEMEV